MLITEDDILPRFKECLSWSNEVDLATAWATSHEGLRALQRQRPLPDIRAVVGLWGNLTDPFALRTLGKIGQLRAPDTGRKFHPKVFIFRGAGKSIAWVGSANFTSGGFGMNQEALFETSDTESVQDWFSDLWAQSSPLDEDAIKAYAEARRNNPPRSATPPPNTYDLEPLQLLKGVTDWRSYVAALEQCDGWWRNQHAWSVLGEHTSWRETAEVLHDVVSQPDWDALDQHDRDRLLGLTSGEDWALFGRMRQRARKAVFDVHREEIRDIVLGVVNAADDAFPQLGLDSYRALLRFNGVGQGIASRLLTLARPDRFVSVNSGSQAGLADSFGLARTTLGEPSNYTRLLTAIYDQNWYQNPVPRNAREHVISQTRAALLDSFVYDPKAAR